MPSAAFKFLRDGRTSANLMTMPGLDGQSCKERNFFEKNFTNHVSATDSFALELIARKFWQGSYCPQMMGVSDLASDASVPTKSPWQIILRPLVSYECSCSDFSGCLENFSWLQKGLDLFEVQAVEHPGAEAQAIGLITLTSVLTTSKFGDEELFFKHQRMEEDFALQPQWLEQIDSKQQCGMAAASTEIPAIENGCNSPMNIMRSDDHVVVV